VLTRREAAVTRAVWLRYGPEQAEELLGVSHHTLSKAAARLPLTASKAALLREQLCQVSWQPVETRRI
jgi:hypothetical protein